MSSGAHLATLALAQGRLREQVEALVARIQARGIVQLDSSFQAIIEALPLAAEEMRVAEGLLGERLGSFLITVVQCLTQALPDLFWYLGHCRTLL